MLISISVTASLAMKDARQQHVEALAQTAVAHAQQHFGVRLDGSDESIEAVERILAETFELVPHSRVARFFNRKPDFHDVARIANMYGAYVGEVLRSRCGGEWIETDLCGCEHILVLRVSADLTLMPTTKTWNRLTMGPSENVVSFFRRTLERNSNIRTAEPTASAS